MKQNCQTAEQSIEEHTTVSAIKEILAKFPHQKKSRQNLRPHSAEHFAVANR
jgi:hypothetical protein